VNTLHVARDLLREAFARKWILGLVIAITGVLALLGGFLQLEVVDGAIAGSRLFGALIADVALHAIYMGVAWLGFFGGAIVLAVACSDFAPSLLSPGRIEHLLSLPVARWQLLLGTWLGVLLLSAACSGYGSVGLTVLFGVKTGVWTLKLVWVSLLGLAGFSAIYAAMLTTALFVRSAAATAAVGLLVLTMGILASVRDKVESVIEPGPGRVLFHWGVQPFPRLLRLAEQSARLAGENQFDGPLTARLVVSTLVFAFALLAVGAWRFERKDF
jgi:Cu-processing system permease protein